MATNGNGPDSYAEAIRRSGLTIYDPIEIGDPELWIPAPKLEKLLNAKITGAPLEGLPLRTRSKVVKERICQALGYPVPSSFRKTHPRFPGQRFDTYIQKSNNLQIWNEEITPVRRYVIIRLDEDDTITKVKVVTGNVLAQFDTTGALTHKYQARLISGESSAELIATEDTERLRHIVRPRTSLESITSDPASYPEAGNLLPIKQIFEELKALIGESFPDAGHDQERNRGAALHRLVCKRLGYVDYRDDGQFPDILHQLLEVKLQTSPTIDLGLVCPDSEEVLDIPQINGQNIRHCDVRYALFYAMTDGQCVTLTHFFLTTGAKFFSRFPQFQGNLSNWKIQIPLPADFFDD
ncbi:MAG: restriction endonuclease [Bacteroidetes bacterium SB0662_bin_6]|nr:restriction endonuclease [Bacteroidetes bacterium SB0668_bin_1]MYE03931.1 restriction endonuclease [Bacteroidetes bacterium SB0662_bin_6]